MSAYDDVLRAARLIGSQSYAPNPPLPPEIDLLLSEFRELADDNEANLQIITRQAEAIAKLTRERDLLHVQIESGRVDLSRVPTNDIAREWLRRYDGTNGRLRELDEMD